ncbi:family 16 glycoside hydrolase [Planctomicrobium piriforme]|uniref:peptidylprolyl isomerase n=1 Tax=Planctomicrobium piriforme TaxID=1576369 RepID=A0A1I3F5K3_9PLAN|nr:family 16 glycoside hydrolase [Planctomicrobium piriforme]SFI06487.1 FKBP-type peptidyl-prolyl cis-trans isomerase [Planctomicrobium piriforme]
MKFSRSLLFSACSLLAPVVLANADDQVQQAYGQTTPTRDSATPSVIVPVAAAVISNPSVAKTEPVFVSLVNGAGLDGWVVQEGKATAWKRDGEMISCTSASGGWLRTEADYSDFELRLEYRLQAGGNTGIGLRCPSSGNPTFTGLEIQLLDDGSPKYADLRADQYTGSIYYQVPAAKKAPIFAVGEWNLCEVSCQGDVLKVKINGEQVNEVQLNRFAAPEKEEGKSKYSLAQRPPMGHVALQSHSTKVDFRKIEIKDLTVRTPSGLQYVDLASGDGDVASDAATVTVHYVGQLIDGKRFTDTRDVGAPVTVALANVIPGWQEGIQGMKVGGRRRLIVPPALGYGPQGVANLIPPDSTLVFEVELCGVKR